MTTRVALVTGAAGVSPRHRTSVPGERVRGGGLDVSVRRGVRDQVCGGGVVNRSRRGILHAAVLQLDVLAEPIDRGFVAVASGWPCDRSAWHRALGGYRSQYGRRVGRGRPPSASGRPRTIRGPIDTYLNTRSPSLPGEESPPPRIQPLPIIRRSSCPTNT